MQRYYDMWKLKSDLYYKCCKQQQRNDYEEN